MKGFIFTEFLALVEQRFGYEMVDTIIESCDLPSGGSYTSVGAYAHSELVDLTAALSEHTRSPVPTLLRAFGEHLFARFPTLFPHAFESGGTDLFAFLESVETVIHAEVQKLYPHAELPHFDVTRPDGRSLTMLYRSARHLGDLAEGVLRGCVAHFGEPCSLERSPDPATGGVRFTLTKKF